MRINQILNEYKIEQIDVWGETVQIYVIGTYSNLEKITNKLGEVRGLAAGNDLWFWDAMDAGHADIMEVLREQGFDMKKVYTFYSSLESPDTAGEWVENMQPLGNILFGVFQVGAAEGNIRDFNTINHPVVQRIIKQGAAV